MTQVTIQEQADGTYTATIQITNIPKPRIAANRKKFRMHELLQGTGAKADCGGKPREITLALSLFCKVPESERGREKIPFGWTNSQLMRMIAR